MSSEPERGGQPGPAEARSATPAALTPRDLGLASVWMLLGLLLYGPGIGLRDLWDPDEPRYAEVAREMCVDGHWLVPHANGRVYGDKPPLFFWTIAGISRLTGRVDAWTARAPSVLCGSLLLSVTWMFGVRRFGRRAAFIATTVLATSALYVALATRANIDQMHALFTASAIFLWFEATERERVSTGGTLAAWMLAGLALMTKGVGILLVLLTAIAVLVDSGRWRNRRTLFLNVAGLALALGMAASWFLPARAMAGGDYGLEILWRQTWVRATQPPSHQRPFYYFLLNFPVDALPWTFFLPGMLLRLRREWRGPRSPLYRFLAGWFVLGLLFFSASASKRQIYLLPLFPAWALATGAWLDASAGRNGDPGGLPLPDRIGLRFLTGVLGLLGLAAVSMPVWGPAAAGAWIRDADVRGTLLGLTAVAAAGGALLLAHGAALTLALRRGNVVAIALCLAALSISLTLLTCLGVMPGMNRIRSARGFAEELGRVVPGHAAVASLGRLQQEVVFYSGRYFVELPSGPREPAELAAFLDRDGVGWVLFREKESARLATVAGRLEEVRRGRAGGDIYVLAREKP